jgi:hypothetical protein
VGLPQGRWRDILTGEESDVGPDGARLRDLLAALPVAVLRKIG